MTPAAAPRTTRPSADETRERIVAAAIDQFSEHSFEGATTRAIAHQFETLLPSGGLLIQFTYDPRGTRTRLLPRFRRLSSRLVWGNLPPARVDVFERE